MRLPIIPTIIVAAAAAIMIALGFWQLGRAEEKTAMLDRHRQARAMSSEVAFPTTPNEVEQALYRHSSVVCTRVLDRRVTAARNTAGQLGLAQVVRCALEGGGEAEIALGWSAAPELPKWSGGPVGGFVAPAGDGARLVASPPLVGEPLPAPDPGNLPNNHLAYAGQWFFFALTALVIYVLALRRRRGERSFPQS